MQSVNKRLFQLISGTPAKPVTGARRANVLPSIRGALKLLGLSDLEKKLPAIIHVAGTKGKGSTCMMCEAICLKAGLRTGLFVSPHLIKVNERFRIDGRPVRDDVLEKNFNRVWDILDKANSLPKYYSFLTILAFQIFASEPLDVVIFEVGMGGTLDATNALERKNVTGITLLDYDHMEFLGDTIEEIAGEKAGIFMKNVPAFTLEQQPEAMKVLIDRAEKIGAPLSVVAPLELGSINLGMKGDHQRHNAALAIELCKTAVGDKINDENIRTGLESCSMSGRAQIVEKDKVSFCFDGAHTPKSMQACVNWFASLNAKHCSLIFNCQHTKVTKELLEKIFNSSVTFDTIIFTSGSSIKPSFMKRPSSAQILGAKKVKSESIQEGSDESIQIQEESTWQETLANVSHVIRKGTPSENATVIYDKNLKDSLNFVKAQANGSDNEQKRYVLVTGSLLLIGDVMKELEIDTV